MSRGGWILGVLLVALFSWGCQGTDSAKQGGEKAGEDASAAQAGADSLEPKDKGPAGEGGGEEGDPVAKEDKKPADIGIDFKGRAKPDLVKPIKDGADLGQALGDPIETQNFGQPTIEGDALQAALSVKTEPGEIPRMKIEVDGKKYDLPLKHTHVDAEIQGLTARVQVVQTYQNPFEKPIETIYVFPLPENSAVDDMKIVIADRVIESEIQERQQARETYEKAKAEGHTAALLEQERPNIFTQSVANIAPGEDIDVVISYVQDVTYDAGEVEWVFPMVVGPRFIPGTPKADAPQGEGWSKDTDLVGDASRITPPIVGGGVRTGHDISIEVHVDSGAGIEGWEVPTHEVAVEEKDTGLELMLAEKESLPNRDFVLRYKVAGEDPRLSLVSERDENGGFFTMTVQPPTLDIEALVGQRELIYVVDVSGSMRGAPLSMCQDAMSQALKMLRPVDTFNVMTFAAGQQLLWKEPRPANDTNIKLAADFIHGLKAGGGTQLNDAVQAALSPPVEQGRHRYVFFMTDGYVGNEDQILATTASFVADKSSGKRKVFAFGVGSSTNTHLLDGMGTAGEGATVYSTNREDPTRAVTRFYGLIDHPVIEEVKIDWGGLDVSETFPSALPPLFASRPLVVHGRFDKGGLGTVKLTGVRDGQPFEMPLQVSLGEGDPEHHTLQGTLWARAKVGDLSRDLWNGPNEQVKEAITKIGLDFRLVTAFTSFVAVDRSRKVGDGDPDKIVQPGDMPEGMLMPPPAPGRASGKKMRARKADRRPKPMLKESANYGMAMPAEEAEPEVMLDAPADAPDEKKEEARPKVQFKLLTKLDAEGEKQAKKHFKRLEGLLTKCYLKVGETSLDSISVALTLDESGKVTGVSFGSTSLSQLFKDCIEPKLKAFSFSSANVTTLSFQVRFR